MAKIGRKASGWFRQQGLFAIAIPGSKDDGWRIRFKLGRREADFETRYVRRRDAERAAEAIWEMLQDGP